MAVTHRRIISSTETFMQSHCRALFFFFFSFLLAVKSGCVVLVLQSFVVKTLGVSKKLIKILKSWRGVPQGTDV